MHGFMTEKLEQLLLTAVGLARQLVLAYLLLKTHLPSATTLLGTPEDYLML